MARILLLHAAVGMGHYRAATALACAFEQTQGVTTRVEDTLQYSRTMFRKAYAGFYLTVAASIPALWSRLYAQTDRPFSAFHPVARARAMTTNRGVGGLAALLAEAQPDVIVCTHFLPAEVIGPQRPYGMPPVYVVVTDYRAHHFWICPGVDGYFVPTDATREQLVAAGVPRQQVHVSGIPVDPVLAQPLEQTIARQQLELAPHGSVVLLNGSGIAPKRVRTIADALLVEATPGTLLIAAGRNRELAVALADLASTAHTEVRVLGQQPTLDPLIVASDVVVGKAGGLTVSEVLARGVPMIIPTPVAGQEQWNAAHVVDSGAGMCCETAHEVAQNVRNLLRDPEQRQRMADAARRVGRPAAALTIADQVLTTMRDGSRAFQVESTWQPLLT